MPYRSQDFRTFLPKKEFCYILILWKISNCKISDNFFTKERRNTKEGFYRQKGINNGLLEFYSSSFLTTKYFFVIEFCECYSMVVPYYLTFHY